MNLSKLKRSKKLSLQECPTFLSNWTARAFFLLKEEKKELLGEILSSDAADTAYSKEIKKIAEEVLPLLLKVDNNKSFDFVKDITSIADKIASSKKLQGKSAEAVEALEDMVSFLTEPYFDIDKVLERF